MQTLRAKILLFCVLLAATAAATLLANWLLREDMLGIDDAYIFLVYAKNFLASGEFVYNLGSERVEGFSSTLWMFVCIAAASVGTNPLLPLLGASLTCAALIIYLGVNFTEALTLDSAAEDSVASKLSVASAVFIGGMFTIPAWFLWNGASLMESPLWGLLLAATTLQLVHIFRRGAFVRADGIVFAALLCALILTRPEAPLWVAWFMLAWTAIGRWCQLPKSTLVKLVAGPLLAASAAGAGLIGGRLAYFGYPLTNTYYAKMSPDVLYNLGAGLLYLLDFCTVNLYLVPGILLGIWGALRGLPWLYRAFFQPVNARPPEPVAELFLLGGSIAAGLAVALVTGGDKFGGFRFYQGIVPLLLLATVTGGYELLPRLRDTLAARPKLAEAFAIAVLTATALTYFNPQGWQQPQANDMGIEFSIAKTQEQVAVDLTSAFRKADFELPPVGVIAAGGFKYQYAGMVYDLMGLNLTTMAHSSYVREGIKNHAAFDQNVFFELRPEIVVPRPCKADWERPWTPEMFEWQVLKNLPADPRFRQDYLYAQYRGLDQPDWICSYIAASLAIKMNSSPYFEIRGFATE